MSDSVSPEEISDFLKQDHSSPVDDELGDVAADVVSGVADAAPVAHIFGLVTEGFGGIFGTVGKIVGSVGETAGEVIGNVVETAGDILDGLD